MSMPLTLPMPAITKQLIVRDIGGVLVSLSRIARELANNSVRCFAD